MARKLTNRQTQILNIFEESRKPLTPQEVNQICVEREISVGLATIYRAVTVLIEEGHLNSIEITGETPRYEPSAKPHHHHFYCQICKRLFDVNKCPPKLDSLVPDGFDMVDHTIMIYGFCVDCRTHAEN